jgi:hypothetical protein
MKKNKTILNEYRLELRFWQMRYRLELRGLLGIKAKIKEIAARMRELQQAPGIARGQEGKK